MNFDLGSLGWFMQPQSFFDPFSWGAMFILFLIGILVALIMGIVGGTIGLTTVLFSMGRHPVTSEDILLLLVLFFVFKWVLVPLWDKYFTDHLHPPNK